MKFSKATSLPDTTSQDAFGSLEIHDSLSVHVYGSHDHPVFSDLPRANGHRLTRGHIPMFSFDEQAVGDESWNGWNDETFMYLDGLISLPISTTSTAIELPVAANPTPPARNTWESSRTSMSL